MKNLGKICRKYRVGYYFPDDVNFTQKINELHAEEYSKNGNNNKIDLDIIDLSKEPNNHFGYQCDTVIIHCSLIKNEQHKENIKKIIQENQIKKENGIEVRDGANIISVYHENDFSDNNEQKSYLNEYKQMVSGCYSAPILDITTNSLINSLVPDYIAKDISFAQMALNLENRKNLSTANLVAQLAAMISITFDAKNPYTKGHSVRVAEFSTYAAKEASFSKEEFMKKYPDLSFEKSVTLCEDSENEYRFSDNYIRFLSSSAMAHDIGKIGIPNIIIDKTSRLTDDEYETMKTHCKIGEIFFKRLSNDIPALNEVAKAVVDHHEYFNGGFRGYPEHKKEYEISTAGRFIAVADAFDAMTSSRSYNNPKTFEEAIIELVANSGTQFDPDVTYSFIKALCKERTLHENERHSEIKGGFLTSPEGFCDLCDSLSYDYVNPPKYDENGKSIQVNHRNYHPDFEALQNLNDNVLSNKENFSEFVTKVQSISNAKNSLFGLKRKLSSINSSMAKNLLAETVELIDNCNNYSLSQYLSNESTNELLNNLNSNINNISNELNHISNESIEH